MSKIDKSKLTAEQKIVLLEEGTEPPGSSELNSEKRKLAQKKSEKAYVWRPPTYAKTIT